MSRASIASDWNVMAESPIELTSAVVSIGKGERACGGTGLARAPRNRNRASRCRGVGGRATIIRAHSAALGAPSESAQPNSS